MLKRCLAALLCACLCLPACGCAQEETLTVTATFYPLYLTAINIARDVEGVEIVCLAPPQAGCLHDYQMTAADRCALADSDVVIQTGAGREAFRDELLPTLTATVVDASAGVTLLEDAHHEHGHETACNPHVWVSVAGAMAQARNIADGLAQADPAHAQAYKANCEAYLASLEELQEQMHALLAPCEGMPIITFHAAFDYLAQEFGLRVVAVVETDAGSAPSAQELANVAEIAREEGVKALFAEPQYDDASVDILARETGLPVYLLDPVVSGEADAEDYDAYLRIMLENAQTLCEALL